MWPPLNNRVNNAANNAPRHAPDLVHASEQANCADALLGESGNDVSLPMLSAGREGERRRTIGTLNRKPEDGAILDLENGERVAVDLNAFATIRLAIERFDNKPCHRHSAFRN